MMMKPEDRVAMMDRALDVEIGDETPVHLL
jgi:hypothetical protein